ncbi:MAG: DUF4974 domain-containing protein [Prevotella sp.]|nr:DUF4974 domain-containing protein [Prevotella sp.]
MESNNDNNRLEELLRKMYAEEALYEESTDADMIDEEWAKFEAAHFHASLLQQAKQFLRLHQMAAILIGVLLLSGISYATIRIVSQRGGGDLQSQTREVTVSSPGLQKTVGQPIDSTAMQPVVFEDAELETILREIAAFYQYETVYRNERVKHVRLYFTWDKTAQIDEVLETCNKFERFHITRENGRSSKSHPSSLEDGRVVTDEGKANQKLIVE